MVQCRVGAKRVNQAVHIKATCKSITESVQCRRGYEADCGDFPETGEKNFEVQTKRSKKGSSTVGHEKSISTGAEL